MKRILIKYLTIILLFLQVMAPVQYSFIPQAYATVTVGDVEETYAGNGSTDTFSFPNYFVETNDLEVWIVQDSTGTRTNRTSGVHYNITGTPVDGVYPNGGSVVFTVGNIPASGYTVHILRNTDLTQSTDYQENEAFPAQSHEQALDKITLVLQENNHNISNVELDDDVTGVLPIANGGTNAITAAAARTSLGVAIGTDVQAFNSNLTDFASKTAPSGAVVGTTDTQTLTNKTLTTPIIGQISNTGTLTLPTSTDTLVGRATTDTLTNKTLTSPTINTPTISGGTWTGGTDLAVADGGTGASDASGARTNLGVVIGTDVQAYDGDLASIASLSTTAHGRGLLDDADAAASRTSISSAPVDPQHLTLATNSELTNERVFTPGANMSATDGGAGSTYTLDMIPNPMKYVYLMDDFLGTADVDYIPGDTQWTRDNSGSGSGVPGTYVAPTSSPMDSAHPGVISIFTGTTTTGYGSIFKSNRGSFTPGGGQITFDAVVKLSNLSTAGEEYIAYAGFIDQTTAYGLPIYGGSGDKAEYGIYFKYKRSVDGDFWSINCDNSFTQTHTVTSVAPTTNWTHLKFVINAAGTSVQFYIDGVSVGTINTNIPTSNSTPNFGIAKTAGTTSRTMWVDVMSVFQTLTTTR